MAIDSPHLVSIVMPSYNASDYIRESIDSVIAQTYTNWELIIVDDCSVDDTEKIICDYMKKDRRISFYRLEQNSGSAIARTRAISLAKGKYIAFLDSDDLWFENKLTEQIAFMEKHGYLFTCTSYIEIDEHGNDLGSTVMALDEYDYNALLKRCPGNLTVIYDASVLGQFEVNNIKRRTDYVLWLQVIKKAKALYGLKKPLAAYRIRAGSVSSKKVRLVKYHWYIYRKIEGLSVIKSIYLVIYIIARKLLGQ